MSARAYEVNYERASLESLSRLTKAESLLPIARAYEVTHESASLASLLKDEPHTPLRDVR